MTKSSRKKKIDNTNQGSSSNEETPDDVPQSAGAEFKFDKVSHDFGNLRKGEKVEVTFSFENVGDEDLIIEFASGSCGCTIPDYPEDPIPPGGTGKIKVEFDTEEKEIGEVVESDVTIIANTKPMITELKMKSVIVE